MIKEGEKSCKSDLFSPSAKSKKVTAILRRTFPTGKPAATHLRQRSEGMEAIKDPPFLKT